MTNLANDSVHSTSIAAWLAEGQSSQRDMLESLQNLKSKSSAPFNIIASHRHNRPEIFEFADMVYREPYPEKAAIEDEAQETTEPVISR